jgi:hypothetical protein
VRVFADNGIHAHEPEDRFFTNKTGISLPLNSVNKVSPGDIPSVDLNFTYVFCELIKDTFPDNLSAEICPFSTRLNTNNEKRIIINLIKRF